MKDYFVYPPAPRGAGVWGCHTTSAGYANVRPGGAYPPHQHPLDHHFTWSQGRILQSYQIVFITGGKGLFESTGSPGVQEVEAGMVLLLFPGVWHRYAPNADTGWVEHWIECRGPAFDRALKAGFIQPTRPVLHLGLAPQLLLAFDHCHQIARQPLPGNQGVLATLGLHILSIIEQLVHASDLDHSRMDEVIMRAHAVITSRCHEPLRMDALARELHVGYSQFRRAFRKQTGQTPKQYHLAARLQQAQKLLANTSKSVKEISELLGFDSPFHLSKQFKRQIGQAPQQWRERQHHPRKNRQ